MAADYLMAGQQSELERLQLQSRVWEPAGQALLARLPSGSGRRVLDVAVARWDTGDPPSTGA